MKQSNYSRRTFIQGSLAAGAAISLYPNSTFGKSKDSPNEAIRVAVIGLNNRGRSHIKGFSKHVVALCDCDSRVLENRAKEFERQYGRKVDTYTDYRKLLERQDIDVVTVATPNHVHANIGIAALQAGKHIYCEKPVSHNVWEGRQLANAAKKYQRLAQCGTQSRSSYALREAVAWVQGGALGKIEYALGTCYKPRTSIGKLTKPLKIPSSIDYDLWCGPAAKVDLYRKKLHYDWHWDFNTGCGDMGNQGIHQMDIARWFLGHKTLSHNVVSVGGRLGYEDAGDTPNTQVVLHGYEGAPIIFETRGLPESKAAQKNWGRSMDTYRGSRIGVIIQCENGHVVVPNYTSAAAHDKSGKVIKKWQGADNHFTNLIDAIRANDASLLRAPIEEGHISSGLCHTGNISHLLGEKLPAAEVKKRLPKGDLLADSVDRMLHHLRKNDVDIEKSVLTMGAALTMDPSTETFIENDKANELAKRVGRIGFEVPEIKLN